MQQLSLCHTTYAMCHPATQPGCKSTSPKPLPLPLGLLLILQIGEMVISRQIISLSHRVLVWQELP